MGSGSDSTPAGWAMATSSPLLPEGRQLPGLQSPTSPIFSMPARRAKPAPDWRRQFTRERAKLLALLLLLVLAGLCENVLYSLNGVKYMYNYRTFLQTLVVLFCTVFFFGVVFYKAWRAGQCRDGAGDDGGGGGGRGDGDVDDGLPPLALDGDDDDGAGDDPEEPLVPAPPAGAGGAAGAKGLLGRQFSAGPQKGAWWRSRRRLPDQGEGDDNDDDSSVQR